MTRNIISIPHYVLSIKITYENHFQLWTLIFLLLISTIYHIQLILKTFLVFFPVTKVVRYITHTKNKTFSSTLAIIVVISE